MTSWIVSEMFSVAPIKQILDLKYMEIEKPLVFFYIEGPFCHGHKRT